MIVVDANILIYSLIKCDQSPLIQKLRGIDADWRTTALCLYETLNMLATYQRREVLTPAQCRALLAHADRFTKVAQCEVAMDTALVVAAE
jgi:predicted nucleic acid-binding protein